MIEIEQLKFQYPRSEFELAIERLQIQSGEKVAIVGPSGSGKTTLLNLIAGINRPDSGSIKIDDDTITSFDEAGLRDFRARQIGLVFQQFELVPYLRAKDNIVLPLAINAKLRTSSLAKSAPEKLKLLTQAMGINDKLRRRPHQLSQGEQQRVAICRALITQPKLILADEPTGNLDPENKSRILDLLFQQANANGQTLIVVTHDVGILDGFDRTIDFAQFRNRNESSIRTPTRKVQS